MKTLIGKIFSILLLALFMLTMNSCEKSEFADLEDPTSSTRAFDGGCDCDDDDGNSSDDDITDDEDDDEDDGDITDDEDDDEDDRSRSLEIQSNLIK